MRLTKKDIRGWVDALRSGGYEQGAGFLCHFDPGTDEPKYCCLGVLAEELYGESCWEPSPTVSGALEYCGRHDCPSWDLTRAMAKRGLYSSVLAQMNDSGKTFEEIADYIEKVAL